MMERPSLHQNWFLKRTSFQAGPDLRSAETNALEWSQPTVKHTDQCRKITLQPVLTSPTRHWPSTQITSTGKTLFMLSP